MNPINNVPQQKIAQWVNQPTCIFVPVINSSGNLPAGYQIPYYRSEQLSNELQNQTQSSGPPNLDCLSDADNRYPSFRLPPISSLTGPPSSYNTEREGRSSFSMQTPYIDPITLGQPPHHFSRDTPREHPIGCNLLQQQNHGDMIYFSSPKSPRAYGIRQNMDRHMPNLAPNISFLDPEEGARANLGHYCEKKRKESPRSGTEPAIILHKKCSFCGKLFAQSSSSKADYSVPASHSSCKCLQSNHSIFCRLSKHSVKKKLKYFEKRTRKGAR